MFVGEWEIVGLKTQAVAAKFQVSRSTFYVRASCLHVPCFTSADKRITSPDKRSKDQICRSGAICKVHHDGNAPCR